MTSWGCHSEVGAMTGGQLLSITNDHMERLIDWAASGVGRLSPFTGLTLG